MGMLKVALSSTGPGSGGLRLARDRAESNNATCPATNSSCGNADDADNQKHNFFIGIVCLVPVLTACALLARGGNPLPLLCI